MNGVQSETRPIDEVAFVPLAPGTIEAGGTVFEIGSEDGERLHGYQRIGQMRSMVRTKIEWLRERSGGSESTALYLECQYRLGVHCSVHTKDLDTPRVVRRFVYENNMEMQLRIGDLLAITSKKTLRQLWSPLHLKNAHQKNPRDITPFREWRRMWTGALAVARIEWAFRMLGMRVQRASIVDDRSHCTDLVAEGNEITCAIQVKGTSRHADLFLTTFTGPPSDEEPFEVRRFYRGAEQMAGRYGGPWVPLFVELGLRHRNKMRSPPPAWEVEDPWLPRTIVEVLRQP